MAAVFSTLSVHRYLIDTHYSTPGRMLGTRVSTENKISTIPALAELGAQKGRDTEQCLTQTYVHMEHSDFL